jgi:hypothetical protein
MADEPGRVRIDGTGGDHVVLTRRRIASGGYGVPVAIDMVADSIRGVVNAELWYLGEFHKALLALQETLTGEAKVWGEGEFEMTLRGNGRGAVSVEVIAVARYTPEVRLSFTMHTDQTFLRTIANAVKHVFLTDPPPGAELYRPVSIQIISSEKNG